VSRVIASDPGTPEPGVIAPTLRAMSRNYSGGHSWDHLDARMCTAAADEIDRLRAQLEVAQRGITERDDYMIVPMALWEQMDRVGREWMRRAEIAEAHLDRLTGMKFSDRMHAALVARAEAAEADAERYRWLRQSGVDYQHLCIFDSRGILDAQALDAAIDASRTMQAAP